MKAKHVGGHVLCCIQLIGGLRPLHFACGLIGGQGPDIVRMLIAAGADRNARAQRDDSYVNRFLVSCMRAVSICNKSRKSFSIIF